MRIRSRVTAPVSHGIEDAAVLTVSGMETPKAQDEGQRVEYPGRGTASG